MKVLTYTFSGRRMTENRVVWSIFFTMNLAVISDDDSQIGTLTGRNIDLLVACGDLYDATILRAIAHYRPRQTLAVRGNHDTNGVFPAGIFDLHLRTVSVDGVCFGGFSGCWRCKTRGHHLFEQAEVTELMQDFPNVDVFVAHNSPAGIHERDQEVHQGFEAFRDYLDRARPRLFIHGHQHLNRITVRGETTIVSVFGEQLIDFDLRC